MCKESREKGTWIPSSTLYGACPTTNAHRRCLMALMPSLLHLADALCLAFDRLKATLPAGLMHSTWLPDAVTWFRATSGPLPAVPSKQEQSVKPSLRTLNQLCVLAGPSAWARRFCEQWPHCGRISFTAQVQGRLDTRPCPPTRGTVNVALTIVTQKRIHTRPKMPSREGGGGGGGGREGARSRIDTEMATLR